MNAVSTRSGLQLKKLEPNQVTHKAVDVDKEKDKKKVVNETTESTKTKMGSVNPPPPFS